MGFRISSIHEYDRFIAVDLWSYRVRAGLFRIKNNEVVLEGAAYIRQKRNSMIDGSVADMQMVSEAIEKAIHEACRDVENIPDDIILCFTPTTCIHDIASSQYIREDSEEALSMAELDQMVEKIEYSSLLRVKAKAKSEYGIIHDDIRLISSTLTSVTVDGKMVIHPIWQTGAHVKISVLNIYALSSEYNILRSIVSSLKKKTISIVPTPLLFSKILENSSHKNEENICIEIGQSHTTIIAEKKGEVLFFDTIPIGTKMLLDMLQYEYPHFSLTEIEGLLSRIGPKEEERRKREEKARDFFHYIIDLTASILARQPWSIQTNSVFVTWGVFETSWAEKIFHEVMTDALSHKVSIHNFSKMLWRDSETTLLHGLALLAKELLHTKKDPIIRILRYTLYHYE